MTQLGQWLFEKQLENTAQLIRELRAYTATVVTVDNPNGVITITDPLSQTTDATLIPVLGWMPIVGGRVLIIPYGSGQRIAISIDAWYLATGQGVYRGAAGSLAFDIYDFQNELDSLYAPAVMWGSSTTQARINMRYLVAMGTQAAVTLTANRLYYIPFYCNDPFTAVGMGVDVMTFVAGDVQMGIYQASSTWQPTALLTSVAKFTVASTGVKDALFGASYGLDRSNKYMLGLCSTSAMAIRGSTGDNMVGIRGGFTAPASLATYMYQSLTAGWSSLPSTPSGIISATNTFLDIYLNT